MRSHLVKSSLILFLISFFTLHTQAYQIPDQPSPSRLVNDYAKVLDAQQIVTLESMLVAYDDSTSSQIAIVIIPKIEDGDDIEDIAFKWAQAWKIGREGKNNGVLILISFEDHKIDIEVGRGMEAVVSDGDAKNIIETLLKPAFRKNDYFGGLQAACQRIMALAAGEFEHQTGNGKSTLKKGKLIGIIIFVIILILVSIFGRKGGGMTGGGRGFRTYGGMPFLGGGGGFGGGSSGGGGFGGFGGGSFGGGGASGSW